MSTCAYGTKIDSRKVVDRIVGPCREQCLDRMRAAEVSNPNDETCWEDTITTVRESKQVKKTPAKGRKYRGYSGGSTIAVMYNPRTGASYVVDTD